MHNDICKYAADYIAYAVMVCAHTCTQLTEPVWYNAGLV